MANQLNEPDHLRVRILAFNQLGRYQESMSTGKDLLELDRQLLRKKFPLLTEKEQESFSRDLGRDLDLVLSAAQVAAGTQQPIPLETLAEFRLDTKGLRLNRLKALKSITENTPYTRIIGRLTEEQARLQSVMLNPVGQQSRLDRIESIQDSLELLERTVMEKSTQQAAGRPMLADLTKFSKHWRTEARLLRWKLSGSKTIFWVQFPDSCKIRSVTLCLFLMAEN